MCGILPWLLQEVLHTISTPSGQVQRIVIFKKNGVQAMVEYPFQDYNTIFQFIDFLFCSGHSLSNNFKTSFLNWIIWHVVITFDSVDSATRAKETLHGADIYSGCCTLKIDYAKVSNWLHIIYSCGSKVRVYTDIPTLFLYFSSFSTIKIHDACIIYNVYIISNVKLKIDS